MRLGSLEFEAIGDNEKLVARPSSELIKKLALDADVFVTEIDATLADTAAFCEQYDVSPDISANCVVLQAKRAERTWFIACVVLATDRADVNKTIKQHVNARKISFAPMDVATSETNMEYGGIAPIGLPNDWPILIDESVMQRETVIIGSGVRASKIALNPTILKRLPNAEVIRLKI